MGSEKLVLIDDQPPRKAPHSVWRLLIVDDETEIHDITRLSLRDLRFAGRELEFLHAYSGAEAKEILATHDDIALTLLDVVMETDDAGLDVVEYIREELKNRFLRIVLRTGQPGQAPEIEVITKYDINDYKQKTELTQQKLFTTIYTGLAAYRDLRALDASLKGLQKVLVASGRIFELQSLDNFAQGVLEQITALLYLDEGALMLHCSGLAASGQDPDLKILAASGKYSSLVGCSAAGKLPDSMLRRLVGICDDQQEKLQFSENECAMCQRDPDSGDAFLFFFESEGPLAEDTRVVLEPFLHNVAIAVRNIRRYERDRDPNIAR